MEDITEIIKQLESHKLPIVKITPLARNVVDIRNSKFGGKPYWPKNKEYPTSHHGQPLYLLAQINFSETPQLANFPTKGIIQFYIQDDDLYGMDFDKSIEEIIAAPSGYRVIYHEDVTDDLSALEDNLPEVNEECCLPLTREYAITFKLDEEMPSPTDCRFDSIAGDIYDFDDQTSDYIYDNFSAEGCKLGGYANFTQDDPRRDIEGDTWLLLFQLDSVWEEDIEIMWGDLGVANFFIREQDLARRDFSKVWYNWDCS